MGDGGLGAGMGGAMVRVRDKVEMIMMMGLWLLKKKKIVKF